MPGESSHVLVVDDQPLNRDLLRVLLQAMGCSVHEAADGEQALQIAEAQRPDLLISDIVMPRMDGRELVARLRAHAGLAAVPVIFYTATYREDEARRVARDAGVQWVLPKPTEAERIMKVVHQALGRQAEPAPMLTPALQGPGLRMSALVEMLRDLSAVRDADELIRMTCRAAQDLCVSRYAAVVLLDSRTLEPGDFYLHGAATPLLLSGADLPWERGLLRDVVDSLHPRRWRADVPSSVALRLPAGHPQVRMLLAVPLSHRGPCRGVLYLADRLEGGQGFTDIDEQMASAVGAQLAINLDSLGLVGDLRRLNEELESRVQARTAQLEAANEDLQTFNRSVSHDLRAPLLTISGFAEVLGECEGHRLSEQGREWLKSIRRGAQRLNTMLDGLLRHARLGRSAVKFEEVALAGLVDAVVSSLRAQAEAGDARIVIEAGLPNVRGDPTLVIQIVSNLLENAIKYRRPEVPARIEVRGWREGKEGVLEVTDNGIGVQRGDVERLFTIFYRASNAREQAGSGIGLALVRRAAELMHGHVWLRSEPNVGSSFFVRLPLA